MDWIWKGLYSNGFHFQTQDGDDDGNEGDFKCVLLVLKLDYNRFVNHYRLMVRGANICFSQQRCPWSRSLRRSDQILGNCKSDYGHGHGRGHSFGNNLSQHLNQELIITGST